MTCWPRSWRELPWFYRTEESALKVAMGSGSWVWRTTVGYMQLLLIMKILTVHPNVKLKIGTC